MNVYISEKYMNTHFISQQTIITTVMRREQHKRTDEVDTATRKANGMTSNTTTMMTKQVFF